MRATLSGLFLALLIVLPLTPALADDYDDTIKVFREAGESGKFFKSSYGYAIFPTIGKGGVGIGGAHSSGACTKRRLRRRHSMTQITVGLQLGGQAFSQIIFFEDKRAFDEFTGGNSSSARRRARWRSPPERRRRPALRDRRGASGGQHDATTVGGYQKGMATFTVAKGGLMYGASIGGQKFNYKPKK